MGDALMERLSGDVPVDTAEEEEERLPQKALDAEDEDSKPAGPQRQPVIPQSARDEDTTHQGTGTKRPHPDDEDEEEDPECPSSASSYKLPFEAGKVLRVDGHDSGKDPGTSAGCPAADECDTSQGKPYRCSECGETFAWISNLMEHHESHSTETCPVSQDC